MTAGIRVLRHAASVPMLFLCLAATTASGQQAEKPTGRPVPGTVVAEARKPAASVTFSEDVAPILRKHCAECHREGEIGPFPLLSYEDAAPRAGFLKEITASRRMPPWHASDGDVKFLDDRRMSDAEIQTIAKWADAGAPRGKASGVAPAPSSAAGWQGGEPDFVLPLSKVEIPADGPDVYKDFVVAIPLEKARWLKSVEIRPGNASVVHHVNIKIDGEGELKKWQGKVLTGTMMSRSLPDPDTVAYRRDVQGAWLDPLLGWVPGARPFEFPEDFGQEIEPGANLVLEFHYHPTGKIESDETQVGLRFTDEPCRGVFPLVFGVFGPGSSNASLLDIPPGAKDHEVEFTRPLPLDARLHTIQAHGHFLMKKFVLTARLPEGKELTLLKIDDWDFNWQGRYVCADPPLLPRGTELKVVARFDNSADNPQNPSDPPQFVRAGPQSTDEMCAAGLILLPENAGGLTIPEEGLRIPPIAKRLIQFDLDQNGRLSQAEFEEMTGRQQMMLEVAHAQMTSGEFPDGPAPRRVPTASAAAPASAMPPTSAGSSEAGVPIPAQASRLRERFDLDRDGRFSPEEYAALPDGARQALDAFLRANGERGANAAPQTTERDREETLRIPPGGLALPEQAQRLKERFDKDKNGKLSQEEFDALPDAVREQLAPLIRRSQTETGTTNEEAAGN